jgi:hypothetical protein
MWDVFFFGTALRRPSHISERISGRLIAMLGRVMDAERRLRDVHDWIAVEMVPEPRRKSISDKRPPLTGPASAMMAVECKMRKCKPA